MTFFENGYNTEFTEEMLYQELADTYQVFLNLFEDGVPLLTEYLTNLSKLLLTADAPVIENPVMALHAARNYTLRLRAPIPQCYYYQEPAGHLVESVLNTLNYKDLVKKQAGDSYLEYEKFTVLLVEKENHVITEGVEKLGLEQTCAAINSLSTSLACPTSHLDA